jgi:hypothetical protein
MILNAVVPLSVVILGGFPDKKLAFNPSVQPINDLPLVVVSPQPVKNSVIAKIASTTNPLFILSPLI